jgi:Domain of unknown function (DUF4365)
VPSCRDQPRKRRTREHVIAELSLNHVEKFIVAAGFVCERLRGDYGYDLFMITFDAEGFAETGSVLIQLKATDSPKYTAHGLAVDLDVRDYDLWTAEPMPVFLVAFDATADRAYWLYVQQYFESEPLRRPVQGAKSIRVHAPLANQPGSEFVQFARDQKNRVLRQFPTRIHHDG